jgi:ZIP family zinc transporter
MDSSNVLFALMLTLIAGASTGIGSFIVLSKRTLSPKFFCGALGFSAGVMLYVSFVEILSKAQTSLVESV